MGILDLFGGRKVLYYPGCLTKNELKEQFANYKEILEKLEINFILLSKEENCCGLPEIESGRKKEAKKLAKKNFDLFKENNVRKIIAGSPECYHMFKNIYPKLVHEWNIEVEYISVSILDALKKKRIKFKGRDEEKEIVSYHDSSYLGRWCSIYDEPREVIGLLGGRIIEMKLNRENSLSCGAGGGVYKNYPEISKGAAKIVSSKVPKEAVKLICVSPLCYINLSSVNDKSIEFSSFVLRKFKEMEI